MKRILFYLLLNLSILSRLVSYKWYMMLLVATHKSQGVTFEGKPEYIHQDAYLDPSGGLTIGNDVVISTRVIILTHDWSFLKRHNCNYLGGVAFNPVIIKESSFIGAGAIVLPGSIIGKNCIIGAGAVVKGNIEDYSIIVGNPAKKIGYTRK